MDNPIVNGLFVFILGLLVVFFGMIIIITAVTICGKIFASTETKPQKKVEAPAIEQVKPTTESEEEVPEHVKVAIIAAISAYYFNAQSKCDFVVKKIKRI
jgi:Na+-transporting methylmalonyl-CoA/oxaloacetate decarboxylase gamma subunit